VFWLKVYEIPEGSKTSKGRAIQNLIQIEPDDSIRAVINVKSLVNEDYINNHFLIMCTTKGTIKKTSLEAYSRPRSNGINAITIHDGDHLLDVKLTSGSDEIVIALRSGRAIRFNESDVRPMGRNAAGVRGVRLAGADDIAVGIAAISNPETHLLVVSEKGYGKRSDIGDYRITKRGGKGVKTMNISEKTGRLVTIKEVTDNDELMIINKSGIIIRFEVSCLRVMGRATQGVRLIKLTEKDEISSVAKIELLDKEAKDAECKEPNEMIALDETLEGEVEEDETEEEDEDEDE
jgi:DNA gyrase subunit A